MARRPRRDRSSTASRPGSAGGPSRAEAAAGGGGRWSAELELPSGVGPLPAPGWFLERAAELGVELEPGEVARLGAFLGLLIASNAAVNLTAITDPEAAWERHALDSLGLVQVLAELPEGSSVLDVGSGGGLPGVPLAVCMPGLSFTLLDATAKKCRFLEHAASELGLGNVRVVCARAERAGHDRGVRVDEGGVSRREGAMRGAFDAVAARAVGPMATVAELTVPFARVGGLVVLTKGQRAEEELAGAKAALHLLHAAHAGTVETPTGRVVVLEKLRETPRAYPRADGEPKRRPLGVERGDDAEA